MMFQTCMIDFLPWNTKEDILKNVGKQTVLVLTVWTIYIQYITKYFTYFTYILFILIYVNAK